MANLLNTWHVFSSVPSQCIVNEYTRNQGITAHTDRDTFGPVICGISIGGDTVMTFERGSEKFDLFLPSRSMMIMSGPARYEWTHAIDKKKVSYVDASGRKITKPQDYRRISLTYRTIA